MLAIARHYATSCTRHRLRALLRETAQPVAVVTSFMPPGSDLKYHGATLSSFTSISMEPYPLISFALRTPSRMAASLIQHTHNPSSIVINILSAAQAPVALTFSRPDLYPDPFSTVHFSLNELGLPVLEGSLGALSCEMLPMSLPLHDLEFLERRTAVSKDKEEGDCVVSELFIARVTRVEDLAPIEGEVLPLLYHRRGFTSCLVPVVSKSKS